MLREFQAEAGTWGYFLVPLKPYPINYCLATGKIGPTFMYIKKKSNPAASLNHHDEKWSISEIA